MDAEVVASWCLRLECNPDGVGGAECAGGAGTQAENPELYAALAVSLARYPYVQLQFDITKRKLHGMTLTCLHRDGEFLAQCRDQFRERNVALTELSYIGHNLPPLGSTWRTHVDRYYQAREWEFNIGSQAVATIAR